MHSTVTLTMVDGAKVVVPDSLDLITPYVLREQRDWFEDEIKLLRRLLQPGQRVIDIGANYGLYTLSIAKTVGSTGHVWAFEPAAATAALLAKSVAANNFGHITLEQCALSGSQGTAQLSVNSQSELNALVHDDDTTLPTETVQIDTLDDYLRKNDWPDIDFVKIDAEGEEANILLGGEKFFTGRSPLVQYEIKAGQKVSLDLTRIFSELGYDAYRLVPGLNVLVPFDSDKPADRFQLNLFACKSDRAATLMTGGWLINELPDRKVSLVGIDEHALNWRTTLATLPYGKKLAARWEQSATGDDADVVEEGLALYALSRDTSRDVKERFCALDYSLRRFESLAASSPTHPRLTSLARIARDYGARAVAVTALGQLCASISQEKHFVMDEPFLAPGERFDSLDPGEAFGDWIMVAAIEGLEQLQSFSSFYTGTALRQRLEMICKSDFAGPEMQRRLSLLQQRFGPAELATSG